MKYITIKNYSGDVFSVNNNLMNILTYAGYSYSYTRVDQYNLSLLFRVCYEERMLIVHFIGDDLLVELSDWGTVDSIMDSLYKGFERCGYQVFKGNKLDYNKYEEN